MSLTQWRPGRRVAVAGGGPGAVSAALAFIQRGYDVRVFEQQPEPKAIGGAVLLNTPVLSILRSYDMKLDEIGEYSVTHFQNHKGKDRVILPFNSKVEKAMGIRGWH
ncbi:hypothetical protein H2203_009263 [Taxawa tesnikishii (nom. ined.)]|nr:hypothetical protein H2203_009263 [Dothideales sp. JES 119]